MTVGSGTEAVAYAPHGKQLNRVDSEDGLFSHFCRMQQQAIAESWGFVLGENNEFSPIPAVPIRREFITNFLLAILERVDVAILVVDHWSHQFSHITDIDSYRTPNVPCMNIDTYSEVTRFIKLNSGDRCALDGQPGAVSCFQLLLHDRGLRLNLDVGLMRYTGIDTSSYSSDDGSDKGANFKRYLPPWNLMMAALAGFSGIGWGWCNLRNERRENPASVAFIFGILVWAYGVYGLFWWSFEL